MCFIGDVPEEVFAQIVAIVTEEHEMLGPEVTVKNTMRSIQLKMIVFHLLNR